jgi:hypothetical protein
MLISSLHSIRYILKMETVHSSETSVNFCHTSWYHIPEDRTPHNNKRQGGVLVHSLLHFSSINIQHLVYLFIYGLFNDATDSSAYRLLYVGFQVTTAVNMKSRSILGCNIVMFGESQLFRRNLTPPSSGSKTEQETSLQPASTNFRFT